MRVGDLVKHSQSHWGFGVIIALIDDHWETRLPSADVLWRDGNIKCHAQYWLEVINERQV